MSKPKTLYYEVLNYDADSIDLMQKHFDVVRIKTPDEDEVEILRDVKIMFAPLGYDFGKEKLDACPQLKIITSSTTGAPHIDLNYAEKKGVKVIYLGPEKEFLKTITATAEHTWGLLLALIRRTPWAFDDVKKGNWHRFNWGAPEMLSRMTLGIIGLGRLGTMVAGYALAFGMKVFYYDPYVSPSPLPGVIEIKKLSDLVSQSDIVTIHAHVTPETENMIDHDILKHFRKGAYLINTARGAVVNQEALLTALKNARLGGVACDVLEDKYDKDFSLTVTQHPLVKYAAEHDNVLITPHMAGSTLTSWSLTRRHVIKLAIDHYDNTLEKNR